jgi:hypothetical protein
VLDEKDAAALINDERTDAKRHATGKAPIKVKDPSDCGLGSAAYSLETHVRLSCSSAPDRLAFPL